MLPLLLSSLPCFLLQLEHHAVSDTDMNPLFAASGGADAAYNHLQPTGDT